MVLNIDRYYYISIWWNENSWSNFAKWL